VHRHTIMISLLLTTFMAFLAASSLPGPQSVSGNVAPGEARALLPDGRWLVVGGHGSTGPVATARIWDPGTQTLTSLSSGLLHPRTGHTATVLPDGTVLILGGLGAGGAVVATAEVFNPQTQTFAPLGPTGPTPRAFHTATLLTDGRVLIAEGTAETGLLTAAELWTLKA
jgi:hypothetical protein